MFEKLKSWLADDALFLALVVVLVGLVSFGLGRVSVEQRGTRTPAAGITFQAGVAEMSRPIGDSNTESAVVPADVSEQTVVASRSGTKYHLPNCPGATQIKEENKLSFRNSTAAAAAGYTPAANCPGL